MLHLCEFYSGICLTTEGKVQKNLSHIRRRVLVYILPTHTHIPPTHCNIHTNTNTLYNNLKQTLCKIYQNVIITVYSRTFSITSPECTKHFKPQEHHLTHFTSHFSVWVPTQNLIPTYAQK